MEACTRGSFFGFFSLGIMILRFTRPVACARSSSIYAVTSIPHDGRHSVADSLAVFFVSLFFGISP